MSTDALCLNLADSVEHMLELLRAQRTVTDENGEWLIVPKLEFASRANVMERAIAQCRSGKIDAQKKEGA